MRQTVLRTGRTPAVPKILHVTVDFGTTFTAAAYAIDHRNGRPFDTTNIRIVSKYPDGDEREKREVSEVPTELLYKHGEKRAQACGWEARNLVKNSKDSHTLRSTYATRFKLLLSQKDNSRHVREDLERRILSGGRSPTDLIVDFLTPLRKHILSFIQNTEDDEEEFTKWTRLWTFTVPADWGPPARRQMLKAAEEAGFDGVVKLISEPEAAALYILEKRVEDRKKLTLENAAVVGDLGGGTIDCATYLIAGFEPLSLSALAHVTGRVVGSSNLNDAFRRILKSRLEDVIDDLERASGIPRNQILDDAVEWFEIVKRRFRGPDQAPTFVSIPWLKEDPDKGFAPGQIRISSDEMCDIFDPIIDNIIELLRKQVFESVHYRGKELRRSKFKVEKIFLSGGLAANDYVQQQVRTAFEDPSVHSYTIPVIAPFSPELAVVQGGVWRSLCPEKITKRLSETSYGFRQTESYTEDWPYGGPGPVKNPVTGVVEMEDRMNWIIKKGQCFKNNDRVPHRLERYLPVGTSLEFEETLYYSDSIREDHVHYENPDIHFLGVLKFNLNKWKRYFDIEPNGPRGPYMRIEYDLVSTFSEDNWSYEIQVLNNKTTFKGSTNITAAFKLSQGTLQE